MDLVPFQTWHLIITVGIMLFMIIIAGVRHTYEAPVHRILNPNHIHELSQLITSLSKDMTNPFVARAEQGKIHVGCTSLGIQLSVGVLNDATSFVHHYSFSSKEKIMNSQTANALADLILRIWYPVCTHQLIDSKKGVYHLVIDKSRQN